MVTMIILSFSAKNVVEGQEIVKVTGKDGKKIYANTEEVYQLVDNANPSATVKIQTTPGDKRASQEIDNLIDHISGQHGVDPELVKAVARVESNYNPRAVSYKGALGLMQLLPGTAKRFGVFNVWDPQQNIEGGVKFLKFLSGMFPNNLPYVLAAYNAGENAVVRHRGIPPYRETQAYVRRITGLYKKGSVLTAGSEPDGGIVCYRDEVGRVVYSNLETAFP
ncbi:MAG: lytic transglycosylase [Acidobacteria bacterium]|nr:MAG: lytic transglycosylase [Acidobacteriota bacterium]